MNEFEEKVIDYLERIYKAVQAKVPSAEYEIKEEVEQDLDNITYLKETEKAILIHKNGYQSWIPKKAIQGGYSSNGNVQSIKVYDWFKEKVTWKEAD